MRNTYAQEEPLSQSKKYILVLSPDKTENRMKSEAKVSGEILKKVWNNSTNWAYVFIKDRVLYLSTSS